MKRALLKIVKNIYTRIEKVEKIHKIVCKDYATMMEKQILNPDPPETFVDHDAGVTQADVRKAMSDAPKGEWPETRVIGGIPFISNHSRGFSIGGNDPKLFFNSNIDEMIEWLQAQKAAKEGDDD